MKPRNMLILLIVAIVLCVAALLSWQGRYNRKGKSAEARLQPGALLLPDLEEMAPKATQILFASDGETLSLQKKDSGQWVLGSNGFPANQQKVNQLVFELSELRVADALTQNSERYDRLGVESADPSRGKLALRSDQGALSEIWIGKERAMSDAPGLEARGGGRFFRVNDDPFVYLVQENLYWLNMNTSTWVETDIVSVDQADVASVTVDQATTRSYTLTRDDQNFTLEGELPENKEIKSFELRSVAGALSNLRLDDVMAVDSETAQGFDYTTTWTAKTKQGTVYQAKLAEADGKAYLRLSAEYDAPVFTDADNATTETLARAQADAEAAEAAVPEFNARHANWIYQVSSYAAERFQKAFFDLLEEKEETTEADE